MESELKEWIQIFLKSRDAFFKEITSFEDVKGGFIVHKKSENVSFFVRPNLDSAFEFVDSSSGKTSLVVLNTKSNLDFLISNWSSFASKKGLCIFFVNPRTNDKWMLYPFTHNQITEKSALRSGLESLFSNCPAF